MPTQLNPDQVAELVEAVTGACGTGGIGWPGAIVVVAVCLMVVGVGWCFSRGNFWVDFKD